jgi:hypothetical protein
MALDTKSRLVQVVTYLQQQKAPLKHAAEHIKMINDPELTKKFEAADKSFDEVTKYIESRIDHK